MSVETMQELLIDELKDLYSAEKQIVKALPKLAKAASTPELQDALLSHLEETKGQVSRLEKIADLVGKKLTGKTCVGMKGVLEEGSEVLDETEEGTVRDAASSQPPNVLSTTRWLATARHAISQIHWAFQKWPLYLKRHLRKKKEADKKLTSISKKVNSRAKQAA